MTKTVTITGHHMFTQAQEMWRKNNVPEFITNDIFMYPAVFLEFGLPMLLSSSYV